MKKKYFSYLLLLTLFLLTNNSFSQSISGVINIYTPVLSIDTCNVTVGSTAGFSVGDKVIIIQMKGASIDTSNTAAFGNILSYNNAGNYEICTISAIAGSVITLQYTPLKTYTIADLVQLIRVPVYTNATITAPLTCTPWNGTIGGVVAFIDNGATVLNADIDVKEYGFRGTLFQTTGWISCAAGYKEKSTTIEALKGECITILPWTMTKGIGAPSNGGGGGKTDNGGGGASNYGAGGLGGNFGWTVSCSIEAQAGKPLSYNNVDNKIFLGGAGGDAQRSEGPGINFGTSGGGIVIIRSTSITGNSFVINVNGKNAATTPQDGGGGGGAAGAVILDCPVYTNILNVKATGGKGGDANIYTPVSCSGGGGGGGGALWVSTPALDPNIVFTAAGGIGGLSKSSVNGSPGLPGGVITDLVIPESTIPCAVIPVTITNVQCNGQSNGSATIAIPTGGPYTYLWSTGDTSATITGLVAGNYTCVYTDPFGVVDSVTITVTEPSPLTLAFTSTSLLCFADCNATITANVGGGTPSYSYSWNTIPIQTTATATGLCAGIYACTVTDNNGCTISLTDTVISPTIINLSTSIVPCINSTANGSATVVASGGTGAFTYSWNTVPIQTTATATGLLPGTYTVTVTDANGCSTTATATIPPCPPYTITIVNVLCNGQNNGSITLTIPSGNPPYTYLWSNGGTTSTISGLVAGTYTCIFTDSLGNIDTITATVTQPAALGITFNSTSILCNGDCTASITATISGGTAPYSSSWNTSPVQTGLTANSLCAGIYDCSIVDANSCPLTQSYTLTEPAALSLATSYEPCSDDLPTGSVMVTVNGGTPGFTYSWNTVPSQNTALVTGLLTGTYTVNVSDTNGCTAAAIATIPICPPDSIFIPNIFSPGGDGVNDVFTIFTVGYKTMHCQIFDRWGVEVFEYGTVNGSWDGTASNGKPAIDGVYFYVFQGEKEIGEIVKGNGFLHLARQGKK